MKIVILRPFDDKDFVEAFAVSHPKKDSNEFATDFNRVIGHQKERDDWSIDSVLKALEEEGWQILNTFAQELTY